MKTANRSHLTTSRSGSLRNDPYSQIAVQQSRRRHGFFLAVAFCLMAMSMDAFGATRTSAQSGPWSTGSTWVGGVAPAATDTVIIANSHTVTLTANASVTTGTVTVQSGGILDLLSFLLTANTLTIDNGGEVKQVGPVQHPPAVSRQGPTRSIAPILSTELKPDLAVYIRPTAI